MGGRGSSSSGGGGGISITRQNIRNMIQKMSAQGFSNQQILTTAQQMATGNPQPQPPQPPQQQIADQTTQSPYLVHTPQTLSQLSDDQLAQLVTQSKTASIPNHLNDAPDATQKFMFAAGMHSKPQVLDKAAFQQYMKDNNIPQSKILSRSTGGANYSVGGVNVNLSADQTKQLLLDGVYTYVGGKHGGNVYGSGTYFDVTGAIGKGTGYVSGKNSTVINAVLSKTANPIDKRTLTNVKIPAFQKSHPKFAKAVGHVNNDNIAIYALAMGHDVITSNINNYHNIIDRSAMVALS